MESNMIKTMTILPSTRREDFENDLTLGHYAWFPVKGQHEGREDMYVVYNISEDNALYLSRKYGLEFIVFIEGSHCKCWEQINDGGYSIMDEKEMNQRLDMAHADDFYNQVSRAFECKLPFFDGRDENKNIMSETMQYVIETIQKNIKDPNEAKRRIETSLTATSGYNRFCNRGELYRNCFYWSCKSTCNMKTMKKVNYSDYKDKYDEGIKAKMETSPKSVDVETMRENLYGYTFTKEYAEGKIPDEFSMDYWEEYHFENDLIDEPIEIDLDSMLQEMEQPLGKEDPGPYFDVSPQEELLLKAIDSTGDGKTPETALCVIDVHQEYEYIQRVVRLFVLRLVEQSVVNGIDCLTFENNRGGIEKVYFDISRRFEVGYPILAEK